MNYAPHLLWIIIAILINPAWAERSVAEEKCSLVQRENDLHNALVNVVTDVDFSFLLERSDGRQFIYNRGAATPEHLYKSASTSKWVTSIIILRLVEQGYLKFSDKPRDYISDWPIEKTNPLNNMTLAQLLSFTSGLTDEPVCMNLRRGDFERCVNKIAAKNSSNQLIPGKQFYYASAHLQVAGLMAIKARGVDSWQTLFREFQSQTGLFPTAAYDLPSLTNPRLAGGMHWSSTEYLAFLSALKNGKLLNLAMMELLLADRTADVVMAFSPAKALGEEWHYGLGYWHECHSTSFANCRAGDRISSPGSYGAYPYWDREKNYVGIVARQGELKSFRQGVAIERAVRPYAEAWAVCH